MQGFFGEICTHESGLYKTHRIKNIGRLFSFRTETKAIMILNENNSMPYMKSLASCLTRIANEGYTEDFKVTSSGLRANGKEQSYTPDEIQVVNFFRFEGESDPDDNAILYVIETSDGTKGTLIDSYGTYNDANVSRFMQDVTIQKKTIKN